MNDSEKRTPIFLPRPTFIPNNNSIGVGETITEEDSLFAKVPEIRGKNLKFTQSGLLLLSPRDDYKFFVHSENRGTVFKIDTAVSIRLPKRYIANIMPYEYKYDSLFVLPKIVNTIFNSDFTDIVLDVLLYQDCPKQLEKDVPLAALYITEICNSSNEEIA